MHNFKKIFLYSTVAIIIASVAHTYSYAQDASLENIKQQVALGEFNNALNNAKKLRATQPNDYSLIYYTALAHFGLKNYSDSLSDAKTALNLAPDSAKPTIQKLIDKINLAGGSSDVNKEADDAYNAGLYVKAAKLYEDAWNKNPTNYIGAARAAKTFNNLGEFERAVTIYQQVSVNAPAGEVKAEADEFIKANTQKISNIVINTIAKAYIAYDSKKHNEIDGYLKTIKKISPKYNLYYENLDFAAANGNTDEVKKSLAQAVKGNWNLELFFKPLPNANKYLTNPEIKELIIAAKGDAAYAKILQIVNTYQDGMLQDCYFICPKMKLVKASNFKMGNEDTVGALKPLAGLVLNKPSEKMQKSWWQDFPERNINIKNDFYIGITEITLREWNFCVSDNACTKPDKPAVNGFVQSIDYDSAIKYAQWLSLKTRKQYNLPTAAEWELACKSNNNNQIKNMFYSSASNESPLAEWVFDDYAEKNKRNNDGSPTIVKNPIYKEIRGYANYGYQTCFWYSGLRPNVKTGTINGSGIEMGIRLVMKPN